MIKTHYLSGAETAKLVRAALAKAFPGIKFSVRSSRGSAINVCWTDGPMQKHVDAVAGQFAGARFDASIDMAHNASLWLLPDGTATVASDPGTTGSMGYHEPVRTWMPHPDAKLISTGAYVFCTRKASPELQERVKGWIDRKGGWQMVCPRAYDAETAVHVVSRRAAIHQGALVVLRDTYA